MKAQEKLEEKVDLFYLDLLEPRGTEKYLPEEEQEKFYKARNILLESIRPEHRLGKELFYKLDSLLIASKRYDVSSLDVGQDPLPLIKILRKDARELKLEPENLQKAYKEIKNSSSLYGNLFRKLAPYPEIRESLEKKSDAFIDQSETYLYDFQKAREKSARNRSRLLFASILAISSIFAEGSLLAGPTTMGWLLALMGSREGITRGIEASRKSRPYFQELDNSFKKFGYFSHLGERFVSKVSELEGKAYYEGLIEWFGGKTVASLNWMERKAKKHWWWPPTGYLAVLGGREMINLATPYEIPISWPMIGIFIFGIPAVSRIYQKMSAKKMEKEVKTESYGIFDKLKRRISTLRFPLGNHYLDLSGLPSIEEKLTKEKAQEIGEKVIEELHQQYDQEVIRSLKEDYFPYIRLGDELPKAEKFSSAMAAVHHQGIKGARKLGSSKYRLASPFLGKILEREIEALKEDGYQIEIQQGNGLKKLEDFELDFNSEFKVQARKGKDKKELLKIREQELSGTVYSSFKKAIDNGEIPQFPNLEDYENGEASLNITDFELWLSDLLSEEEAFYHLAHEARELADKLQLWEWAKKGFNEI